ncbi:MAG: DUF4347 domain-containing protein [Cyanobacteria bacterium SID2]|nr:DUF4347 domain-containing protein [Cyanobacteria bacterium SID2]MBP0002361.1 DUF4347 domain-containing protein [Cyanobacteria bacterium SBC]
MSIQTLLFVDSRLNIDTTQIASGTEVVSIDPETNGIDLISETLAQYRQLNSIQLLGHGDEGRLSLGNVELNAETLTEYENQVRGWKSSLAEDADILMFNCNVAAGELGKTFVQQIRELTDADIAASTDLTGNAAAGGDWELEYQTGKIEAEPALQLETLAAYDGVLIDVNSATALKNAIDGGTSAINLTGNITLSSSLPLITSNVVIDGNGYKIDGGDQYQIFTVKSGASVTLRNLTLEDGLAKCDFLLDTVVR